MWQVLSVQGCKVRQEKVCSGNMGKTHQLCRSNTHMVPETSLEAKARKCWQGRTLGYTAHPCCDRVCFLLSPVCNCWRIDGTSLSLIPSLDLSSQVSMLKLSKPLCLDHHAGLTLTREASQVFGTNWHHYPHFHSKDFPWSGGVLKRGGNHPPPLTSMRGAHSTAARGTPLLEAARVPEDRYGCSSKQTKFYINLASRYQQ